MMALAIHSCLQIYETEHTELWKERKIQITSFFGCHYWILYWKCMEILKRKKNRGEESDIVSAESQFSQFRWIQQNLGTFQHRSCTDHLSIVVTEGNPKACQPARFRCQIVSIRLKVDPTNSNQIKPDPAWCSVIKDVSALPKIRLLCSLDFYWGSYIQNGH